MINRALAYTTLYTYIHITDNRYVNIFHYLRSLFNRLKLIGVGFPFIILFVRYISVYSFEVARSVS